MQNELRTRDVVAQLDTRLGSLDQAQRDLRAEAVTRFAQVDSRMEQLRAEMTAGFSQLCGHMERRFLRLNGMMVSVLLAAVVGVGGLWLK